MKYAFKHLIIIILLFITGNLKAQSIDVKVNENIELMSILSRMAGFPEYSMDLAGQYISDMDSCFNTYRSHPAITYMKELRKKHGISFDAVMDMAIRLELKDGKFQLIQEEKESLLDKRWNNANKEEFLTQLNGFYQDTDFHTFFTNHAPLYQQGIEAYKDKVMSGFNQEWYSKFYGKEAKEKFGVIIGFCNGGGNYGIDLHPSGQAKQFMIEEISKEMVYLLIEEKGMSMQEALHALYTSDTYARLTETTNGLYTQSTAYVYEYLENELTKGKIA